MPWKCKNVYFAKSPRIFARLQRKQNFRESQGISGSPDLFPINVLYRHSDFLEKYKTGLISIILQICNYYKTFFIETS